MNDHFVKQLEIFELSSYTVREIKKQKLRRLAIILLKIILVIFELKILIFALEKLTDK